MTPDEILTVVQAWKDGKPIQCRVTHTEMGPEDYWEDHVTTEHYQFDFSSAFEYRVKPERRVAREWVIGADYKKLTMWVINGPGMAHGECVRVREVLE